jgi:hypothetical protein
LAIVSGANSYRGIRTFIKVHRRKLNKAFKTLERFPGRLNLGVFSCWREYDSSVLL